MHKFSLNHDAIGTTRSGSFTPPGFDPEEWIPHPESYWTKTQGDFDTWRESATLGDKFYVESSVYWTRVS